MKKLSLGFISFLQATGIAVYCSLVGTIMLNGGKWFGPMPNFLGPTLFLLLFVVSAVVCGLIFGAYPFLVFWDQKNTRGALKLVVYTGGWLVFYFFLILIYLLANR